MKRRIVVAKSFSKDVKSSVSYISRDKPIAAKRFKGLIKMKVRSLSSMSERGRIVPETIDQNLINIYREIIIGNYRLIYKVTSGCIFVLRLIHGHQNIQNIFFESGQRIA